MDANHTVTAHYVLQYQLTVRTSGLDTEYAKIYNSSALLGTTSLANPYSGWRAHNHDVYVDVNPAEA